MSENQVGWDALGEGRLNYPHTPTAESRPNILPGLDYEKAVTSLNDAKVLADVQSDGTMPFSVDQLHKRAEIYALLATIGSLSGRDTELSENLSDAYLTAKAFSVFVESMYSMESYHGEPMIQELMLRTRDVLQELEMFRDIFEYTIDTEIEDELNAATEEEEEA